MTKFLGAIVLSLFAIPAFAQSTFLGRTIEDWQQRLAAEDAQDRHQAAWALAQYNPAADRWLLAQSKHPDPVVRFWLLQGIGRCGANEKTAEAREPYLKQLRQGLTDKSAAPRIAAAEQLARLGAVDEALPVLSAALDDPQESAATQAAAALAALGKQAAPAQAKLQSAAKNGGEYVKRLATRALKNLGVRSEQLED